MITKKIKSAWKTRVNGFSRNKLALGLLAAKTSRIETWDWMLREVTICPNKITCKNPNDRARQQSRAAGRQEDAVSAVINFGSQVSIVFSLVQSAVNIALTETVASLSDTTNGT